MSEDKLKIDNDGSFYRWKKLIDIMTKVEPPTGTAAGTTPTAGKIPGINFDELLKGHIGKEVKISIEIKNES